MGDWPKFEQVEQWSRGGLTLELLGHTNELIVGPWGKWSAVDMVGVSTIELGFPSFSSLKSWCIGKLSTKVVKNKMDYQDSYDVEGE